MSTPHNTSSVTDMLQNLNWPSLEIRRTRVRLIMFYKIIHHVVAIHPLDTLLLPTTTITRYNSSHTYQHIRTDKDSYKYSFYPRTIIQWNLLPIHVHEAATVDAFKALVPVTVLLKSQVVLLQTAHSWANAGVLLGARMHRERGSFRNN